MAERYSKRRFLSNFGATQGPKGPDVSGLSRAMGTRQQALSTGLDAIQSVLTEKLKKGAEKRAAQNAVNNDPYVLMQQTEGSINYEDELTRKHAITKIGNDTLSSISLQIAEAEQESIINDESSAIFNNKITNIIRENIKSLRDSGVDSPILELEIQESVAGGVRQTVSSYAAKRIKIKQDMLNVEIDTSGRNAFANAGRHGDDLSVEKMNNWMVDNSDWLAKNPGKAKKYDTIYKTNKAKSFVDKITMMKDMHPSNKQLRELRNNISEFETTLDENPHPDIVNSMSVVKLQLDIYEGKNEFSAQDLNKGRGSATHSDYILNEQKNYSTKVSTYANIIDGNIARYMDMNERDFETIALVIEDTDAGPVSLTDKTKYVKSIREYYNLAKKRFEDDERGFIARGNDKPTQMINNGQVNQKILFDRLQDGYSLISNEDAADFKTNMPKDNAQQQFQYINNYLESAGPYKNIMYGSLLNKLEPDDKKTFRMHSIGMNLDDNYMNKEYSTNIVAGVERLKLDINSDNKKSNENNIEKAIAEVLPANLATGRNKPGYKQGVKDSVYHYIYGKHGDVKLDYDEVKNLVSTFSGNETTTDGLVNGFVDQFYLDKNDRPQFFTNGESIESGFNFLSDDTLPLYTQTLNPDTMQFESFTEPMYGIEGVFETYTAGKGITKDSVPLNAMKVKTFFTPRNADPSDFDVKDLPIGISHMAVLEDAQGNILKNERGAPILLDLKLMGYEYNIRGISYDVNSEISDYAYTIGGLKVTKGTKPIAGGPSRGLDPDPMGATFRDEILRLRMQESR